MNPDKVCVCIPTLNEESSVEEVVYNVRESGYDNILVIDGGSDDNTQELASKAGAEVHQQEWDGEKGAAMREAFSVTNEEVVVFLDGDGTYEPAHIDRLVSPIFEDGYDHVIGSRFADMKDDAMSPSHRIGNKGINLIFRVLYRENLHDILSGFRAVKRDAYEEMELNSTGFDIETELAALSVKRGHSVLVTPTSYYDRKGESKLEGFSDGFKIVKRMVKSLRSQ